MKTVKSTAKVEATITIELTENEARALDQFAYFGAYEETYKFIHQKWSNDINSKHLNEFFQTVHEELNPHLSNIKKARSVFENEAKV